MVKGTKITYIYDINLLDIYRKYGGAKEVELSIVQIVQLVEMEELKDENKRLKEQLDKIIYGP